MLLATRPAAQRDPSIRAVHTRGGIDEVWRQLMLSSVCAACRPARKASSATRTTRNSSRHWRAFTRYVKCLNLCSCELEEMPVEGNALAGHAQHDGGERVLQAHAAERRDVRRGAGDDRDEQLLRWAAGARAAPVQAAAAHR